MDCIKKKTITKKSKHKHL